MAGGRHLKPRITKNIVKNLLQVNKPGKPSFILDN